MAYRIMHFYLLDSKSVISYTWCIIVWNKGNHLPYFLTKSKVFSCPSFEFLRGYANQTKSIFLDYCKF